MKVSWYTYAAHIEVIERNILRCSNMFERCKMWIKRTSNVLFLASQGKNGSFLEKKIGSHQLP